MDLLYIYWISPQTVIISSEQRTTKSNETRIKRRSINVGSYGSVREKTTSKIKEIKQTTGKENTQEIFTTFHTPDDEMQN